MQLQLNCRQYCILLTMRPCLVLVAIFSLLYLANGSDFTVTLVDHNETTQNFLFRGPEMTLFDSFMYEELRIRLRLEADLKHVKLPDKYYVVDVCLLQDKKDDHKDEKIEREYFEKHPDHGEWVWWPTDGTLDTAYNKTEAELKDKINSWTANSTWIDPIQWRVEALREWLNTANDIPYVMYVHCHGGKDRTGETIGSYYMKYQGLSLKEATKLDEHIAGRPIGHNNQAALDFYCFFLKYRVPGFESMDCDDPYGV